MYNKGVFVAVRNVQDGFFVCQLLEPIPTGGKKAKKKKYLVQWLEEVDKQTYKLSYKDRIYFDSIIDEVTLVHRRSFLKFSDSENKRILSLLAESLAPKSTMMNISGEESRTVVMTGTKDKDNTNYFEENTFPKSPTTSEQFVNNTLIHTTKNWPDGKEKDKIEPPNNISSGYNNDSCEQSESDCLDIDTSLDFDTDNEGEPSVSSFIGDLSKKDKREGRLEEMEDLTPDGNIDINTFKCKNNENRTKQYVEDESENRHTRLDANYGKRVTLEIQQINKDNIIEFGTGLEPEELNYEFSDSSIHEERNNESCDEFRLDEATNENSMDVANKVTDIYIYPNKNKIIHTKNVENNFTNNDKIVNSVEHEYLESVTDVENKDSNIYLENGLDIHIGSKQNTFNEVKRHLNNHFTEETSEGLPKPDGDRDIIGERHNSPSNDNISNEFIKTQGINRKQKEYTTDSDISIDESPSRKKKTCTSDEDISIDESPSRKKKKYTSDEDISSDESPSRKMKEYTSDEDCLINEYPSSKKKTYTIDEDISSEESLSIRIPHVNSIKEKSDKRKKCYDQKHACFYCDKLINKMSRHLETIHNKETEVGKILALPKNSKERRESFLQFTRFGDYYYNLEILSKKSGELILIRRPTPTEKIGKNYSHYVPCPHCLGFLLKKHLWAHIKYNCSVKKNENSKLANPKNENQQNKNALGDSIALLSSSLNSEMSKEFEKNILRTLTKTDDAKAVCLSDPLILRLGTLMYEKWGATKPDLIRQHMRQMGRLVTACKINDPKIKNIFDCLQPNNFDSVVHVVKDLCNTNIYETERPDMGIPSLALKIGHGLRRCAAIQRGLSLRKGDLDTDDTMKSFLHLMDLEWSNRISSIALSTLEKNKLNKELLLPLTKDLLALNKFLDNEISSNIAYLKENPKNTSAYKALIEQSLSRIILFNKKRSGEAAKMTLINYSSVGNWQKENSDEILSTMTPLEQKLMNSLTLVYIVGKRGRNVPVLLTSLLKNALDVIVSCRNNIKEIRPCNTYIFAKLNSNLPLRGHEVLKKCCAEAGLERPELITSTRLRKYVATVTQVVNLSENEVDWLARHLGHDIRVHREFYRLQESAVELTKVSRLLLAVDQGKLVDFAGKTLSDIDVDDLPSIAGSVDSESETQDEQTKDSNNLKSQKDNVATTSLKAGIHREKKVSKKKTEKTQWNPKEKTVVLEYFRKLIKQSQVPGKAQCEEFLKANETCFTRRLSWRDIKYCVYNHIQKLKN